MYEITSEPAEIVEFSQVKRVEGFDRIKSEYASYLTDEGKYTGGPFDWLFFPKNEGELAAVVREMTRRKIFLTVSGARTGLVGGCVPPSGALISLEHMNRVMDVYRDNRTKEWMVRAETGITLNNLNKMALSKVFPDLEHREEDTISHNLQLFRDDKASYFYPPDPTETSASLGATVVTNASGSRTYRFGPTRDWVRGIRVMMMNGEILDIPRGKYFSSPGGHFKIYDSTGQAYSVRIPDYQTPRTKNTAGLYASRHMDLIDLFIGSEGVLGIITMVDVALFPWKPKCSIIQFTDSNEQTLDLVEALRTEKRLQLDFLEFYSVNALNLLRKCQEEDPRLVGMPDIPEYAKAAVFFELSFDPECSEPIFDVLEEVVTSCGTSLHKSWAGYETRELGRFKSFRHLVPEKVGDLIAQGKRKHPDLHRLSSDLAVPEESLRKMWELYQKGLDEIGIEWVAFGHIGDSHIHVSSIPKDMDELARGQKLYAEFAEKAVEYGGTVSAEHGIGKIKAKFLKIMFNPDEIDQMLAVKKSLDPEMLLNPGNMFSES